MNKFNSITGSLYGVKNEKASVHGEDKSSNYYENLAFISCSGNVKIAFHSIMSNRLPISTDNFQQINDKCLFYPPVNEVCATYVYTYDKTDKDLIKENVNLEYTIINDQLYLTAKSEVTAHSIMFKDNSEVYEVEKPLIFMDSDKYEGDELLNIGSVTDPILVRNLRTNVAVPLSHEKVMSEIENNENNGIIEVTFPNNPVKDVIKCLSNED